MSAATGHDNSGSLAKMQSAISNGRASQGTQLLSRETINRVFVPQPSGTDQVLLMPVRSDFGDDLAGSTNCFGNTSGNRCY
ncbi:hypothetical protein N9C62_02765 [Luminiphilus sp.]|nr:hypothetical protein [Luminiphilus sp.]